MEYLAKQLPPRGGKVIQMEDEISSIAAVLGAYYGGARSMTATSGPGLALMTELITWGVMTEIPAVILDAQRGGPSTGLPTKTEQSDLHAAVWGGPGDSPRIVIAPTNVAECYHYTMMSFQLAEKYQTPVIALTDFFLDNRVENIVEPEASEAEKANGNILPDQSEKDRYERFKLTDSGISPRAIPGMEGFVYTATGLEHSSSGSPNYESENHLEMCAKRERKINRALEDLPRPVEYYDEEQDPDIGIIGWGSTFGSALEAVGIVRKQGIKAQALKVTALYPYHGDIIREFMNKCKAVLIPELNHSGQLANLIGHLFNGDVIRMNRAAATPMTPGEIVEQIERIVGEDK
jgi:2-oxoglutarate ferredoxin oxidoreductase subunit alpha